MNTPKPKEPVFDADGYPTEETLKTISEWPSGPGWAFLDLMEYVRKAWKYGEPYFNGQDTVDKLFPDTPIKRYAISTGGWSGNEVIIGALRENRMFWAMCWVEERRGGHFIFELREVKSCGERVNVKYGSGRNR